MIDINDAINKLRNRVCGRCNSTFIIPHERIASHYQCQKCGCFGRIETFPEMTIFHQITSSEEVLAEKFVYPTAYVEPHYTHLITRWHSTVTEGEWETKPEAITATRWKLKEVAE